MATYGKDKAHKGNIETTTTHKSIVLAVPRHSQLI